MITYNDTVDDKTLGYGISGRGEFRLARDVLDFNRHSMSCGGTLTIFRDDIDTIVVVAIRVLRVLIVWGFLEAYNASVSIDVEPFFVFGVT